MESPCFSKHNSSLLILMMLLSFMVGWIEGVCIEDERKALLEIKASLHEIPYFSNVDYFLTTWVGNGECCDWERITCNPTTGYITDLYLSDITSNEYDYYAYYTSVEPVRIWSLNFSSFLHFKGLRSLDLSWNYICNMTGLEKLGGLKKLEILNLSTNYIETNIFPSLGALPSLKILDLSLMNQEGWSSPTQDISQFSASENLELLDLSWCGCYGNFQMQGFEGVSILRKLKTLNLANNYFNESLITSLSALPSLTALDLGNPNFELFPSQGCKSLTRLVNLESISIGGYQFNTSSIRSCLSFLPSLKILEVYDSDVLGNSFPMQELSSWRELKILDLSDCGLTSIPSNGTMSNLVHLNLERNDFSLVDDIMTSMAAFPSLKFLSLRFSALGGRLFANGPPNLPNLEVLLLSENGYNGTLPIEALASFHHLEVLDLSRNHFVGSIPATIKTLSSLKVLSLTSNNLSGSLSDHGLCELKNIHELDLSHNMFNGNLPQCFSTLSTLKFFDISSNQLTGILMPSLIANLTSLEYVDFSHNNFEGPFSFSSFSNHTKLEFVAFRSDNDKFEMETEVPIGWIPMFQLKVLVMSNCNINRHKGSIVPRFLLHQHKLKKLDMSRNFLEGQFPNWLIKNNTMLEVLNLSDNSLGGMFSMPHYRNPNTRWLDLSKNHMIGLIPSDIQQSIPYITYLNLSWNSLDGAIPSSFGDLSMLDILDLSHNELDGEVPTGLFTALSHVHVLKLSNNGLHGEVLSGNLNLRDRGMIHLDGNCFSGKIGNTSTLSKLDVLDISNNSFTGLITCWISNTSSLSATSLSFLDLSQNYFSGPIPSCLIVPGLSYLHLGYNNFTGSLPNSFRNLTSLLILDVGNNSLSGSIPEFLGELSRLRILLLGKNNFNGSIPTQLCQWTNLHFLDLSGNFLSGSIPACLQNITGPSDQIFIETGYLYYDSSSMSSYRYNIGLDYGLTPDYKEDKIQDEVFFTIKALTLAYRGDILDIVSGLDVSSNKLTGDIPEELGMLTHIHSLNLSHNRLTGPIPVKFSNLVNIESLDLSSNSLTGKVPSELINLYTLEVFNVSFNNLSGRLPDTKAQFGTFDKESYKGNPFLCGPPLENPCANETYGTPPSNERSDEKWYDIDMISFYGSFGATWFVFVLGIVALLYINPYWRRRWLNLVEESLYTCYYLLYDSARKICTLLFK